MGGWVGGGEKEAVGTSYCKPNAVRWVDGSNALLHMDGWVW